MSRTLTLEVPDDIYQAIQQVASKSGQTAEEAAREWLSLYASQLRPSSNEARGNEAQRQAARQRFERHFGSWDSGDPYSADNERIDADLARVYGGPSEGQA